jgi:lipopolysaccharide/colanic/teichoic acid biosynthesis glycosyltransferase
MAKRLFDIVAASIGLTVAAPILLIAMLLVWLEDGQSPLYRPWRVGRGDQDFRMVKLRTMTAGADAHGASSTARSDPRITWLGARLRALKLDELPQFWNVLRGEMSIVGPRPNLRRGGTDCYTSEEARLLSVRPGITDLASIVFSDEGEILDGAQDPDALYDAVIRPWKSRLGLLYIDRRNLTTDLHIIWLTALCLLSRRRALDGVSAILREWQASDDLRRICARRAPLPRADPPGAYA